MIIPLNTSSTIAHLRRSGVKVAVLRRIDDRGSIITRIVITVDGKHSDGYSISHPQDRYNRKLGNKIALGRAIKNYNEGIFCEFVPLALEL